MSTRRQLTLVQLNDSHAYFEPHQELFWTANGPVYRQAGGYARIAALLRQIRQERPGGVLFLDNGDALHGTYAAVKTEGRALVPILNELAPAAMTAHWDFAYGPQVLRERAAELKFPILAGNVYDKVTGERPFPGTLVTEAGGVRIGVIGLASNIVDKSMPASFSTGLRFTLGRDELPGFIEELRDRDRVEIVVLLSHLGFPLDMRLLEEVPGVDVCLSGHTHNRLVAPVRAGQTLVIQSGCHGSFLGRLDLELEGGRITEFRHRLITVDDRVPLDGPVAELVRSALAPYQPELSTVVGETATALNRATTLEATSDNLLLQALLEHTGAEVAFSNGWRYGAPAIPGPVTVNDLYNLAPMNPPVSTVNLTGDEILRMIEENLARTFAPNPYEQMGGYVKRALGLAAHVKIENPAGTRVQRLFIGDGEMAPAREYHVAFITEEGVPRQYGRNRQAHQTTIVGALRSYLERHDPARAELRGTFTLS